ncbi:MAG: amidase family protein, partial [Planctomycetota bacterium]
GLEWRTVLRAVVDEALEHVDFLATPTVAALRKDIGVSTVRIQQADVPYRMALSHFTSLVNQLLLPAVALPLNANGTPPPSVQFIGPAWSEHRLLELGIALESAGIVAIRRPPGW